MTTKTTTIKRGRKPQFDEPGKRDTAYLPQSNHEILVAIGDDNFSRGVRVALEAYRRQFGDAPNQELLAQVV
jgi:hypothetical protein